MSRPIKFRAWDKEYKEYRHDLDIALTLEGELYAVWAYHPQKITSNRFIIEQYTGLKDKNGKKIYVGDILETCCGKAEVYFDDELLMYRVKVRHGGTMPLVSKKSKRHFDYEIIGNIHESPELVKVK